MVKESIRRIIRVLTLPLAIAVALATFGLPAAAADRHVKVTFVLFSDLYEMAPDADGRGGLAKLATVVKRERAANPNTLVVHAGDAFSPSLLSSFDRGKHMVDLLNAVGLDVFVPGNHEFDFGPEIFRQRIGEAKFPVVATNLSGANGVPVEGVLSNRMIELDGVKIGVAGFITETTATSSSPVYMQFSSVLKGALDAAAALRKQGADIVVQAVHTERPVDEALIAERAGDLILSGHDHDLLVANNGMVAFAESMHDAYYVTCVDLDITVSEANGKRTVSVWPNFRILDTKDVPPDPDMTARVEVYQKTLSASLDQPLVKLLDPLDSRVPVVRGEEAAIGDLFADALRATLGAEVAILNGGGIRGDRLWPAGTELVRRDIVTALPFGNTAVLLDITGKDLRQALEQAFAQADRLTGAFPQVSGMRLKVDLSRPKGDRIVSIEVAGQPLDPAKSYRLATNDYLAEGGNGYFALERESR